MHKVLYIAIAAADRAFGDSEESEPGFPNPDSELIADTLADRGFTNDAAAGNFGGASFELGLEQEDARSGSLKAARDRGQDLSEGDE